MENARLNALLLSEKGKYGGSGPPPKPKRKYLPLSLSFDDARIRKKRFEQRQQRSQENEQNFTENRPLYRMPTKLSLCNSTEIPYIDADPFTISPHIPQLTSPVKYRAKPKRNHWGRPKSVIVTNSDLFDSSESNPSTPATTPTSEMRTSVSPTPHSYAEWKRMSTSSERKYSAPTERKERRPGSVSYLAAKFEKEAKLRQVNRKYGTVSPPGTVEKCLAISVRSQTLWE